MLWLCSVQLCVETNRFGEDSRGQVLTKARGMDWTGGKAQQSQLKETENTRQANTIFH